MCHTTLQHYIHCRHTNFSFHHCHQDRHSPTSFTLPFPNSHLPPYELPSQSQQQDTCAARVSVRVTHPNYAPSSPFQPHLATTTTTTRTSVPPNTPPIILTSPRTRGQITDDADYRSHDLPLSIAHSYRRKCPACVAVEIRGLVHVEREKMRRERMRRWVRRVEMGEGGAGAGGVGVGVGGSGAADAGEDGAEVEDQEDEEGMEVTGQSRIQSRRVRNERRAAVGRVEVAAAAAAAVGRQGGTRNDEMARRAVVRWQRYAERGLVEGERSANRESRRARRLQLDGVFDDDDGDESDVDADGIVPDMVEASADQVALSLPRSESPIGADDGRADRRAQEERRRILQAEQRRAPATIEASIDPARLGRRVRQRQLDLMEQARLYELQIWSQRNGGGGLTDRQRELLTSGPLLVPIPEDRMVDAETALREITGSPGGLYPPNMTAMQVETYRRWGVYSMLQAARRTPPPWSVHAQIDGLDDTVPVRVRFAGVDENGSPRPTTVRRREEDVVMTDDVDETLATESHRDVEDVPSDDSDQSAQRSAEQNPVDAGLTDPGAPVRDMPTIAVDREPSQNREAWEIASTSASVASEDTDMESASPQPGQTNLETTTPAEIATSVCPCHQSHDYHFTSNLPTHSPLLFRYTSTSPASLATLRDSPFHATLPLSLGPEELSSDTHEILVSFQECNHNLAVFVPKLEYEDASHIRADCGCYGFDRCLVAARRAKSLQECLVCRMKKERERWARMTERDREERCPWFERWVRVVEGAREVGLWPYGARDSLLEM